MQDQASTFEHIANTLYQQGWCVLPNALPKDLCQALYERATDLQSYTLAGVGRHQAQVIDNNIRSDKIHWIESGQSTDDHWLTWMSALQQALNRRLYLGLFSYESHYAHYAPGKFYQKHVDSFKGQANRILSTVCYLNPQWQSTDGGELILYSSTEANEPERQLAKVSPQQGTLVIFLSEEFPHEVLPARADRYSIAGWFRLNSSQHGHVYPPR